MAMFGLKDLTSQCCKVGRISFFKITIIAIATRNSSCHLFPERENALTKSKASFGKLRPKDFSAEVTAR
jgi:hypothetical protein